MKHTKRLIAILSLLLIPLLFLTSCGETVPESKTLRTLTDDMIVAMKTGDAEAAFSLVAASCTQEEFDTFYEQFEPVFLVIEDYELYLHATAEEEKDGRLYESAQYILLSDAKQLVLSANMEKGTNALSGFLVGEPEENLKTYIETSGTVTTLDKTTGWQWVALAASLLEIAFILWMAIDCALRKIESKFLWISLILLGIVTLSFSFGDGSFGFDFAISFIFDYTALIGHVRDLVSLHVMLPIGAVVYFFLRKRLKAPTLPEEETKKVYKSYIPDDEK
ncbi:MAG: hypothetical protein IJD35_07095 [Clostridia bacterium]|nr:hypothetical protein [Clostridia bacterium]